MKTRVKLDMCIGSLGSNLASKVYSKGWPTLPLSFQTVNSSERLTDCEFENSDQKRHLYNRYNRLRNNSSNLLGLFDGNSLPPVITLLHFFYPG